MADRTFGPDLTIAADALRQHMAWYVALVGGRPVFTTNREIIDGTVGLIVVADEDSEGVDAW